MPISRLRLRFAASFAIAFLIGLGLLETALVLARRRAVDRELTQSLVVGAQDLDRFLAVELDEEPSADRAHVLADGLFEYLPHDRVAVIADETGRPIAYRGPAPLEARLRPPSAPAGDPVVFDLESPVGFRAASVRFGKVPGWTVTFAGPTDARDRELDSLIRWLLATAPIVVLLSAAGGYLLSQRAVHPIQELETAIEALPGAMSGRLPVRSAPDELDHLATRFNGLLDRLQAAESENRRFVQHAAHQIRTPLTLVLGEADLALAEADHTAGDETALRRVRAAAHQMKHRVDELFLLAQSATGGDPPIAIEPVDLEELAFEATDLMRGRAAGTGHRLELRRVEAATAEGNPALLKEALIELLENACRHGDRGGPIGVSAFVEGRTARIEVWSGGPAIGGATGSPAFGEDRIGLRVVDWIARRHGGALELGPSAGGNRIGLAWPAAAAGPGGPA